MKKSLLLLTCLFSLIGCSKPNSSDNSASLTSVYSEPLSYSTAYGNKIEIGYSIYGFSNQVMLKDAVHLLNEEEGVAIKTQAEKSQYVNKLKSLYVSGSADYHTTVDYLNGIEKSIFDTQTLIMSPEMVLDAHGIDINFDGAYLKNNVLTIHIIVDDHSWHHQNDSSPISDKYQVCTFLVDKFYPVTSVKVEFDYNICK